MLISKKNSAPLFRWKSFVWVPKPTSEEHASLRFIDRLRLIDTLQRSIQTIPEVGSSMSALTLLENIDDLVDKTDKRLVGWFVPSLKELSIGNSCDIEQSY